MGYIKIAHRKILNHLDSNPTPPNNWKKFIQKQSILHNLIIKSNKNKCFCTYCKHEFISNKEINRTTKCPNCNNKYLIKRSNLRHYEFKDYLSILDFIDNTFIIRYFELKTIIDATHNHNSSVVEFGREIINNNYSRNVFVNERVSKCQCNIHINHSNYFNEMKWRKYTRYYSLIDYSIVFPDNIKEILKDTEYKYSYIWELAKHSTYIDLLNLIRKTEDITKVELLTKMKLYNLALSASDFKNNGSFQKIFGIPKDYYTFMKRNNITYKQLKILRLLKEKDISKIRYLEQFTNYDMITDLEEISKYISLNRFVKYAKMHHGNVQTYLYKDYLRFAKTLGYDLKNNKYAFPKNLKEEHDKLEKQYKIHNKKLITQAIIKRGKELSKNTYQNNKFIILPACTFNELQEESKQQHNCVRTYAEKYANGQCDIYFMRDINNKNQSLVTVEVKGNRIVQSKTKNNFEPTKTQKIFLAYWEKKVLKGAA